MDCLPGKVLGTCFTFHVLFKSWVHVCSVTHSCLTLCNPLDCCLPGSFHRIFQARIPAWVAMPSTRGSSLPKNQTCVSCIGRWIPYLTATWEAPCKPALYVIFALVHTFGGHVKFGMLMLILIILI